MLPAMCGSATAAMEVSSTSMNVGSMTEMAMSQGLTEGRHSAIQTTTIRKSDLTGVIVRGVRVFRDDFSRRVRHARARRLIGCRGPRRRCRELYALLLWRAMLG